MLEYQETYSQTKAKENACIFLIYLIQISNNYVVEIGWIIIKYDFA